MCPTSITFISDIKAALGRRSGTMGRYCVLLCLSALLEFGLTAKAVDDTAELSRIKASLAQLQGSNRRLERQNRRLQQVWNGLQTMCSAIQDECTCNGDTGPVTVTTGPAGEVETSTTETGTEDVYETTFQLEAIESSGIMKDDSINVTAVYTYSPDRVFTEWRLQREKFRALGLIRHNGTASTRPTDSGTLRTSSFNLASPDNVRYFELILVSGSEELNVVFNVSALYEKGVQEMKPWNATVRFNSPGGKLISPLTDDLRFNVTMDSVGTQPEDIEVQFMGVNTSAAVPETFEALTWQGEDITFALHDVQDATPERSKYGATIELRNAVSRYGGLLVVRVVRRQRGYTKRDGYAIIQDVFATGAEDIIPINTFGFFPLPKQMFAISPEVSVVCAAMGNPQPHITITKSGKGGKTLEADLIYEASYLTVISYTLNTTDTKTMGKYTCNLHDSNDPRVILSTMTYDLITPKEFEFHEDKTGVTKNNSKKILVSCKASGTPRPELGFSLYEEYGPDVSRSGLYKVSRTYPSANTARIQMTMSPVNPDITRLYCGAGHPDFDVKFYRIDIFPDSPEWQRNWELYDQIKNLTRFDTFGGP